MKYFIYSDDRKTVSPIKHTRHQKTGNLNGGILSCVTFDPSPGFADQALNLTGADKPMPLASPLGRNCRREEIATEPRSGIRARQKAPQQDRSIFVAFINK